MQDLEQLFGSKTRVKLLTMFVESDEQSYFVREITRKIDEQINSVRRELANLLSIGIVSSSSSNNKLYYKLNKQSEYFEPMRLLFGAGLKASEPQVATTKTVSPDVVPGNSKNDTIKALFKKSGNITQLLLLGRFVSERVSGVDLIVVGDINTSALHKAIKELERLESADIRYAVFSDKDWEYRKSIRDRFVTTVLGLKVQKVIEKY